MFSIVKSVLVKTFLLLDLVPLTAIITLANNINREREKNLLGI